MTDPLRRGLDDADNVALGIVEQSDLDPLRHAFGPHDPRPAEALGLGERRLDVGDLDVEGDVAGVALRSHPDAAADPDAVGVEVALPLDDPVVHRVVRVELPSEQVRVVGAELVPVLPDDLEVDYRLSHPVSFPRRRDDARANEDCDREAAVESSSSHSSSIRAAGARAEKSPSSRSRAAALAIAPTATQARAPPTLTRCAPASTISPSDRPGWARTLIGFDVASDTARISSPLRRPGA